MTHNRVRQQIININDRAMSVKDIVHELPWIHHNNLTLLLYHQVDTMTSFISTDLSSSYLGWKIGFQIRNSIVIIMNNKILILFQVPTIT